MAFLSGAVQIITVVRTLAMIFALYQIVGFRFLLDYLDTHGLNDPSRCVHAWLNIIFWVVVFFINLFMPW